MHCLKYGNEVPYLDNAHLARCCGLMLQKYTLHHKLLLDILVLPLQINITNDPEVE